MEIFTYIWIQYLYIPLFNFLIYMYVEYAGYNFALAVIILTILLRIVLLPFSVLSELGKNRTTQIRREIFKIEKDYQSDPVQRKLAIRQYLKKKRVRPWSKAILLGTQFLVLVLLYQVFLGGIDTAEKMHLLYPSLVKPDFINTNFLWFDIARFDLLITAIVSGYIFAEQIIDAYFHRQILTRREQIFIIMFPAFVFLILAVLPSVKSAFVLPSLGFSSIITIIAAFIRQGLANGKKKAPSR